jgi:hypothetical protein
MPPPTGARGYSTSPPGQVMSMTRPEIRAPISAADTTTGQPRMRSLPAGTVEFPVLYAAEEGVPLL